MDHEQEFLAALALAGGEGSMWEVGEGLGLDRAQTESLATGLMARDMVEMVSLSGKLRLTAEGAQAADPGGGGGVGGGDSLTAWLAEVRAEVRPDGDLASDLACLEAQGARSRPLGPVLTACLEAAARALEPQAPELARRARDLKP